MLISSQNYLICTWASCIQCLQVTFYLEVIYSFIVTETSVVIFQVHTFKLVLIWLSLWLKKKKKIRLHSQMYGLDVMMSICNSFLTPAQWALHTSLALWWRRWWRWFPAPGNTLGLADWGLVEEGGKTQPGEGDRKGKGRDGRGEVLIEGARGKGEEGRGRVSWASTPPSHASCVFRSSTCPALKSDKESISTKNSVFTQNGSRKNQMQLPS